MSMTAISLLTDFCHKISLNLRYSTTGNEFYAICSRLSISAFPSTGTSSSILEILVNRTCCRKMLITGIRRMSVNRNIRSIDLYVTVRIRLLRLRCVSSSVGRLRMLVRNLATITAICSFLCFTQCYTIVQRYISRARPSIRLILRDIVIDLASFRGYGFAIRIGKCRQIITNCTVDNVIDIRRKIRRRNDAILVKRCYTTLCTYLRSRNIRVAMIRFVIRFLYCISRCSLCSICNSNTITQLNNAGFRSRCSRKVGPFAAAFVISIDKILTFRSPCGKVFVTGRSRMRIRYLYRSSSRTADIQHTLYGYHLTDNQCAGNCINFFRKSLIKRLVKRLIAFSSHLNKRSHRLHVYVSKRIITICTTQSNSQYTHCIQPPLHIN